MRHKPTYQELANAALAKTQLGAAMQPYVPYNDNALAAKELRAMTDRLALEARVNQSTQAQVFATAAETGLPPRVVRQMVDHVAQGCGSRLSPSRSGPNTHHQPLEGRARRARHPP